MILQPPLVQDVMDGDLDGFIASYLRQNVDAKSAELAAAEEEG